MRRGTSTRLPLRNWKMDGFCTPLERNLIPPTMVGLHGRSRSHVLTQRGVR